MMALEELEEFAAIACRGRKNRKTGRDEEAVMGIGNKIRTLEKMASEMVKILTISILLHLIARNGWLKQAAAISGKIRRLYLSGPALQEYQPPGN